MKKDQKLNLLSSSWQAGVPDTTTDQGALSSNCAGVSRMLNHIGISANLKANDRATANVSTVMGSMWNKVELESNKTMVRSWNTVCMSDSLASEIEKSGALNRKLNDAVAGKHSSRATLVSESDSSTAMRHDVHALANKVIETRKRLAVKRQADLQDYQTLMDPKVFHAMEGQRLELEKEIGSWHSKLRVQQILSEKEISMLQGKLQCKVVAEQHSTSLAFHAEKDVIELQEQIDELEAALALAEDEADAEADAKAAAKVAAKAAAAAAAAEAASASKLERISETIESATNDDTPHDAGNAGDHGSVPLPDEDDPTGDTPGTYTDGNETVATQEASNKPAIQIGGTNEGASRKLALSISTASLGMAGNGVIDETAFGLFVEGGNPVEGLDHIELDIDGISCLPASLRATYMRHLGTHYSQLEALTTSLREVMVATSEFNRSLNFFDCQEWIHNKTAEILDCMTARVLIYDAANAMLSAMTLGVDGAKHDHRFQAREGLTVHALSQGPGTIVVHPRLDPEESMALPDLDHYSNYQSRSMMIGTFASPSDPTKVSGVLQVFNKTRGNFTEGDTFAFRYILRQASVAMANAVAYREQCELADNLAGLESLCSAMYKCTQQKQLVELLCSSQCKALLKAHRCQVSVMNPIINAKTAEALSTSPTPSHSPRAGASPASEPEPPLVRPTTMTPQARRASLSAYTSYQQEVPMSTLVKEAVRRKGPLLVTKAHADSRFDAAADVASHFHSLRILAMPIHNADGETVAALTVTRGWAIGLEPASPWQDPGLDAFSAADIALCVLLCKQAAVAFDNVSLCKSMSSLPAMLTDTPANITMEEVTVRVVGALMQICPSEEVHIAIPCEHRQTYVDAVERFSSNGMGEARKKHYPITGLMALPFHKGQSVKAVCDGETTKVFWGASNVVIPCVYPSSGKGAEKKEAAKVRKLYPKVSPKGFSLQRSRGLEKLQRTLSYSQSIRQNHHSLTPTSVKALSTRTRANSNRSTLAGLAAGAACGVSGATVDPSNLRRGFKSLFLLPVLDTVKSPPQVIAVVQLVNRIGQRPFSRCDDALLRVLASQASVLIGLATLQGELGVAQRNLSTLLRILVEMPEQGAGLPQSMTHFNAWLSKALMELIPGCDLAGSYWVDAREEWDGFVEWNEEKSSFDDVPTSKETYPSILKVLTTTRHAIQLEGGNLSLFMPLTSSQTLEGLCHGVLYCRRHVGTACGATPPQSAKFSDAEIILLHRCATHVGMYLDMRATSAGIGKNALGFMQLEVVVEQKIV